MYKLCCRELGFDCDFTIKKSDTMTIVNNFCKHLINNHNTYFPTNEVFKFIGKQNKNQIHDAELYSKFEIDSYQPENRRKWFSGRKNFP